MDPVDLKDKKALIIVIALVVVLGGGLLFMVYSIWWRLGPSLTPTPTPTASPISQTVVDRAETGKLIGGFPSALVVDKNAVITGSVEGSAIVPDARSLSTSYETKLSLSTIKQKYTDYFNRNKWTIVSSFDQNGRVMLSAFSISDGSVTVNAFAKGASNINVVLVIFNAKK